MHITAPYLLIIDKVTTGAITREYTAYRNLSVYTPLPHGSTFGVIKYQLDRGTPCGFAIARAVKNHVLHGFTTQFRGLSFAQHPAYRIDNIRLTAAIRANHANQLTRYGNHRSVNKRLKTR